MEVVNYFTEVRRQVGCAVLVVNHILKERQKARQHFLLEDFLR